MERLESAVLYINGIKYIIHEEFWLAIKGGRIVNGGTFKEDK